jgi:hypothetical protein
VERELDVPFLGAIPAFMKAWQQAGHRLEHHEQPIVATRRGWSVVVRVRQRPARDG